MEKSNVKTDYDMQEYIVKNAQKYKTKIDSWLTNGPRDIKKKVYAIAQKALAAKAITNDEFFTLLECANDEPESNYGVCKFSFPLEECQKDAEFKELVASIMAMLAFFGRDE